MGKVNKCRDRSVRYLCVGENFKDNISNGYCGDVKTLLEWLIILSHKDEEFINSYFDSYYTNNDIVDYIFSSWGKRLKEAEYESM